MLKKLKKDQAGKTEKPEIQFNYFRPISRIAFIYFVGLSLFLFVAAIISIFLTKPGKEVRVPYVTGKQFIEVYNGLSRKGLVPEVRFHEVYDMENGFILSQYPESGSIVPEGTKIKLGVSRSVLYIEVPSLVGIELPFAINKLKNMHVYNKTISINTGIISYVPSKSADNIVIGQSPRAGERITPDQKINILVSSGKLKEDNKMPLVIGQSVDLATSLLLAKGLLVRQDIVKIADKKASGSIVEQKPPRDEPVKKGDTAIIKVGFYPLKDHPYHAYEAVEYAIPSDGKAGLYEAYIEDSSPKRIAFSDRMKGGGKIAFMFHRHGTARVKILCDKQVIKEMKINVDEFD